MTVSRLSRNTTRKTGTEKTSTVILAWMDRTEESTFKRGQENGKEFG